jgi:hypothetical protein
MKVKLTVDLLRDNNSSVLGTAQQITKTAATHNEAKALVQAEIDARVLAATTQAQELADANTAFNS